MTGIQKGLIVGGVLTLLPIWRCAGGQRGMNFWQYANVAFLRSPGSYPHIPIEEAIERARSAYCEVKGLNCYEEVYSTYPVSRRIGSRIPSGVG